MSAGVFRFEGAWEFPDVGGEDVYDVLARGELVPQWRSSSSRAKKVAAKSVGDFEGLWMATLSPRGTGAHVDLMWQATVLRPMLKFLAPVPRPAFAWNHRWTMPRGEKGLRDYLAARKQAP